tara:strand:- start:372 stop:1070 length:699 start_codon:yes stop_codon:yes gene_type:complete
MNKLILGYGLLGSELVKKTGWDYISRKKDGIDFTDFSSYRDFIKDYDVIINCIAHTDTYSDDREKHWSINYEGVSTLVHLCNVLHKKLVHISTDFVYANSKSNVSENDVPVHCENWYGYTKLLGDGHVQLKSNDFLLLRGTHKKEPFPFEEGLINQIGNFDYVDKISDIIINLIEGNANGIYNVGTELKTTYDLAKRTKDDVISANKTFYTSQPVDVSMDLSKLKIWEKSKK